MNEAYQRVREDLPEMRAPDANSFPVDAKRVKAWVEALPRANQQATIRQLKEALESLGSCRLDGAQRLAALELMRPSILDAIGLLDKRLLGSTFPLPPTKAKVADQIRQFQRELTVGYRIAVVEMCAPVSMREIQRRFVARGVWVRPFGRLVYLMPPYIIGDADLATLCESVVSVVGDMAQAMPG